MSKLYYVIGASGAGKDTIMNYARHALERTTDVVFAHRYITRPAFAGTENHIALSLNEFMSRRAANLFALYWHSHDTHYGIGIEIDLWLEKGMNVIVNGSRGYLREALNKYPQLTPISIEAHPDIIAARLNARGRENPDEIIQRVNRTASLQGDWSSAISIQNDGRVEEAGDQFVEIIRNHR